MLEFIQIARDCAPHVAPQTLSALVRVESGMNPLAIGVVGGQLAHQPRTKAQAVATARALERAGWNFSLGIAQVNRYNLPRWGLTYETAFEPCANLRAGAQILGECYARALPRAKGDEQTALASALSCYYSGNFTRGFKPDTPHGTSYVQRVADAAGAKSSASDPIAVRPINEHDTPLQLKPARPEPAVRARDESDKPAKAAPGIDAEQDPPASENKVEPRRSVIVF